MPDQPAFDHQQVTHAIRSVCTWLDLREKHGYAAKYPANSVEAWHSGLLYRLLRGVEPLPEPPENSRACLPLDFQYPEPTWVRRQGASRADAEPNIVRPMRGSIDHGDEDDHG